MCLRDIPRKLVVIILTSNMASQVPANGSYQRKIKQEEGRSWTLVCYYYPCHFLVTSCRDIRGVCVMMDDNDDER